MACAGQARPKFSLSVKDLASGGKPARGGANSWWTKYGGTNASYNPAGPHNCTLYAAFRLAENGLTTPPGWAGDADEWAELAYRAGDKVDQVPAVGAIAQWNGGQYGHVAYVEAVTPAGIIITDDNYYTGTRARPGATPTSTPSRRRARRGLTTSSIWTTSP